MKALFATLLIIPCIGFAQSVQNYQIDILDDSQTVIHHSNFSYPSANKAITSEKERSYVELCLKNKDKIEYSNKTTPSVIQIDTSGRANDEDELKLHINTSYLNSVNIGDCNIEVPVTQHFQINTALPFFLLEQRYNVLDENGKSTNKEYTVKIQSTQVK